MYLPPVEKKPQSPLVKWTVRLFLLVLFVGFFFFLSLNFLAGKTDAHKKGLEAALSELVKKPVIITELKEFNIIPQFHFEVNGVTSSNITVEKFAISYGFWDLFLGRPYIESLRFENLRVPPAILTNLPLFIENAAILDSGIFTFNGFLGKDVLKGTIPLTRLEGRFRPSYHITQPEINLDVGVYKIHYKVINQSKSVVINGGGLSQEIPFTNFDYYVSPDAFWFAFEGTDHDCSFLRIRGLDNGRANIEIYGLEASEVFDISRFNLKCTSNKNP